jgi:ABC-2 type transport system ATP-binding protein
MITVSGLTKRYGDRTVVDDVSFELETGTVTGFLGPNGAGKTTTMRMITGLVPATSGRALVNGRPYTSLANPGAVMGTLLDAGAVHPGRTGRAHLGILASTIGVPSKRVDEVLELVGLADAAGRRIGGYSLGMRQRLGIAGALLADPPVLMFDEPANGLDPEGIRWMRDLLRGHAARGGTVLLSSHLLGEVEHTVDRLVVIGGGRIVADGPIRKLLGGDGTVVRSVDAPALATGLRAAGLDAHTQPDGALMVPGATPEQVGRVAASHGLVLTDLRPLEHGLEDLFFSLTTAPREDALR